MLYKRAICKLPPREAQRGFYSNIFLVPKRMSPVINLKALNQFVKPQYFNADHEGAAEAKRLVNKNGSERCILYHPDPPRPPAIPEVCSGGAELACPSACPVHPGSVLTSGSLAQRARGEVSHLYRRYPGDGRD